MIKRDWLKEIREERKLTLRELAPLVDCSFTYLCDIERGRRRPSGRLAYKISKVLKFDMERFFTEEEKQKTTA
jgi:putative transcriptional regulator